MASSAVLISVIIPTRHRNETLARCLDCLTPGTQQLPSELYEVIVTDDGSNSTAEEMMRTRYPWAQWVGGPRHGPSANRNFGAAQGNGKWLAFVDDDCVPSSDWLQAFHAEIRPGVNVYEGKTTSVGGINSPLEQAPVNEHGGRLWSCNMMLSSSLFKTLGGFDEDFPHAHMEDVDFRERILGLNETIHFCPAAIVDHPARKVVLGLKAAPTHESEFMFYYKSGHTKPYLQQHLYRVLRARLSALSHFRPSRASLTYALAIVPELTYVLKHGGAWQRKYRELYRDYKSPYTPGLFERVGQR